MPSSTECSAEAAQNLREPTEQHKVIFMKFFDDTLLPIFSPETKELWPTEKLRSKLLISMCKYFSQNLSWLINQI